MRNCIPLLCWLALIPHISAQDASGLIEQGPAITGILSKVLIKAPGFVAKAEVTLSGSSEPGSAISKVEIRDGRMRWDVRINDIQLAQLSVNAKNAVRKVNGDSLLLLTRADLRANYLVFNGARVYLEQALMPVKLSERKKTSRTETIDGRLCSIESINAFRGDGSTNQVLIWTSKDLKGLPVQIQLTDAASVIRIRFREVRLTPVSPARFDLPTGLARHENIEDLIQSVVLDGARRRLGL